MNRNRIFAPLLGCLFVTVSSAAGIAHAAEAKYQRPLTVSAHLPSHYPQFFPALGVLTEMRSSHNWVISGKTVKVSSNVVVHSLVTDSSSLYAVKQGMDMAYRKNDQNEITEVWLLPAKSVKGN